VLKKEAKTETSDLALYVHWPFCKFKCPYCDFNSHVRERVAHADWRSAYRREMEFYREKTGPRKIASVFFGGGTPSLMETETAARVIQDIDDLWGLPQGTEITLEANPTSVEAEKLKGFKAAGVNRVSLGVQALNDSDLKKLGRQHSAAEAIAAVKTAAKIFDRYTFDLIYARPDQTVALWREELGAALEFAAGHMSLYQLTIEPGTQYYTLHQRGELKIPDEETAAALYETTQEMMEARNMPAYEISNHAAAGQESRHNLVYWRYGDYAGIGPGAHGRLTLNGEKFATRAHRAPELWLERVAKDGHGAHPFETVSPEKRGSEMLMMGLRLKDGVKLADFEREAGRALAGFVAPEKIKQLEIEGLVRLDAMSLVATPAGRQRLDAVLRFLLA
jgi:putative oxygen-independent coproporphyrinogen III oxidase